MTEPDYEATESPHRPLRPQVVTSLKKETAPPPPKVVPLRPPAPRPVKKRVTVYTAAPHIALYAFVLLVGGSAIGGALLLKPWTTAATVALLTIPALLVYVKVKAWWRKLRRKG